MIRHSHTREILNLFPNDINSSIIRRVELSNFVRPSSAPTDAKGSSRFERMTTTDLEAVVPQRSSIAIKLPCYGQDGGRLSCSWGTVEEEMGDSTFHDELVDWDEEEGSGSARGDGVLRRRERTGLDDLLVSYDVRKLDWSAPSPRREVGSSVSALFRWCISPS